MDTFSYKPTLTNIATNYLKKAQAEVKYCINCQPRDGGDYVWVLGEQTTLKDIFCDLEIPEKYHCDIAQHIVCPYCGCDQFDEHTDVGREDKWNIMVQEYLTKADRKYGRQVALLQDHLQKYPLLSLTAPLAKTIYREITRGKAPTCSEHGLWFKSRPKKNKKIYRLVDMQAAPVGCSSDGRYNHAGQSVLYLANHEETAMCETIDDLTLLNDIWIQKYEINISNILDLTHDWDNLGPSTSAVIVALLSGIALSQKVEARNCTWKPEYFITRFISDCARAAGFNGIRYNSTRGVGTNLVIFTPDLPSIIPNGSPELKKYNPHTRQQHCPYTVDF